MKIVCAAAMFYLISSKTYQNKSCIFFEFLSAFESLEITFNGASIVPTSQIHTIAVLVVLITD